MGLIALALCCLGAVAAEGEPPPDRLAVARARGASGFYAARDDSAHFALRNARDDGERMEALKLLADTAARTGDWTSLEDVGRWPAAPGPDCACDELAWHAAIVLRQTAGETVALAWLAAASPASVEAKLVRAEFDLLKGRSGAAATTLEAVVDHPGAAALREHAVRDLARLRCVPATYAEATALLDTLPQTDADVTLARAWCAVDAGRVEDLAAQLPTLDAAERAGAWLPSLPLLHALADGQRDGLEAARAGYAPLRARLSGTADAMAQLSGSPEGWIPALGLPVGLEQRLRSNEKLIGLQGRVAALEREDKVATDLEVREELGAEREAASARGVATVGRLLDGYAREVGWLDERAATLLAEMETSFDVAGVHAEQVRLLRKVLEQDPPLSTPFKAELITRLAHVELGRVPTEASIESFRASLATAPTFYRRDLAAWSLALLLIDAGRPAEAEAPLNELIAESPPSSMRWQAFALLGDLAFARKDFNAADVAYAFATGAPDRRLALYAQYRRAWCAWAMGQPAAALLDLVIADPDTPEKLRRDARSERRRLRRRR